MRVNLRVVMCIVVSLAIVGLSANVAFAQIEVPGTCQKIANLVPFDSQPAVPQPDVPLIWQVVPECPLCEFHRVEIHVGKPDKEPKLIAVDFECKATGEIVPGVLKAHEKGVDENPNHEVWSAEFTVLKCFGEVNVMLVPVLPVPEPVIKVAFVSKLWDLWNCSPIGGAPWGNEEINVHVGKPDQLKKIDRVGFVCVASGEQRIEEDWKGHEQDVDTNPNHELWGTTFADKCAFDVDVYLLPVDKGNKAEIKAAFFTNITPLCEVMCKGEDEEVQQIKAVDVQSCRDECRTVCVVDTAVEWCRFKDENIKGNCHGACQNSSACHHTLVPPDNTRERCLGNCDQCCGGRANVAFCEFKGVPIEGNCDVLCKDGTEGHAQEDDVPACQTECNTFCAPHDGVFACFFKDVNVKGNCDVFCKNETFDHITLENPTDIACHTACDDFCGGNENVQGCFLKGENLKGGFCTADCKDGASGVRVAQNKGECHDLCDDICGGTKENVLWCQFKEQYVKGNCDVVCKDDLYDHIMLPSTNPPYENTPDECQTWCKETCLGHGGTATCDHKGDPTIPAVTEWGLVVMGLLVLTAGTMVVLRRRPEIA